MIDCKLQWCTLRTGRVVSHTPQSLTSAPLPQDGLKARQKDISAAQQNRITAIEARDQAEAKLRTAKADHEKAFEIAKARGILPELPGSNEKR